MIAYINEEADVFSVADMLGGLCDKLLRRHPHVFGDVTADTPEAALATWKEVKENIEGRPRKDSLLDSVSRSLPPLERAYKIQKKAAKVGFDWRRSGDVWRKAREELGEARAAFEAMEAAMDGAAASCDQAERAGRAAELEAELGDLLFSVVNLCRFLGVDPSLALRGTVEKFARRFRHVEKRMADCGKSLSAEHMELMDFFWDEAKAEELPR